jgi:hypothetical protein
MNTFRPAAEQQALEKLREEELQEARAAVREAASGIALFRTGLLSISDQHLGDRETHLLEAIFLKVENFRSGHAPHDDLATALFRCSE